MSFPQIQRETQIEDTDRSPNRPDWVPSNRIKPPARSQPHRNALKRSNPADAVQDFGVQVMTPSVGLDAVAYNFFGMRPESQA